MKNSREIGWFALLMVGLLLFAAACGPSAPPSETEAEDEVIASTAVTSNDAYSTDDPTDEPAATKDGNETISVAAVDTESAIVKPVSSAKEVDANGIEVGFTEDGHAYKGSLDAPVVIEEYSDYQCPFCTRFAEQTMPSLLQNQVAAGDVVIIFNDFPLTGIHPQAVAAANAARCAGEQSPIAYWEMHDLLFDGTSSWANGGYADQFSEYAKQLDLDTAAFDACVAENRYDKAIQSDLAAGQARGVNSTPSFFVNERPLVGAQPISVFDQAIAQTLSGEPIAAAELSAPSQPTAPQAAPTPVSINMEDIAGGIGDPNAPVTIVEYTDYQCPFCQRHSSETFPTLLTEMIETGRIYYALKDFPLDNLHSEARVAAAAARCAGEQEAYWEMHNAIFDAQSSWADVGEDGAIIALISVANDIGLDTAAFQGCMGSGRYDDVVQENLDEGSSLGVQGTPHFFIDGYPVSGAQPYELFEFAIGLAEEGTLAEAYAPQEQPPQAAPPEAPPGPIDVPIDGAYAIGDPDAPVTIVEYTDFQCPFCSRHFQQTYPQIKENFIDKGLVYYVFKDFPLNSIHPQAAKASEAARCAGDQDAYVEMHDMIFDKQNEWAGNGGANDIFVGYASEMGLDMETFSSCLNSDQYADAVAADLQEGYGFGVSGTPAFFINGNFVSGAQPYSVFEQAINSLNPNQ